MSVTALEEVQSAVERLSPPERQALLDWMSSEPVEVAAGIFRTPGVCGGEACVRAMRLPVWQLEESRRNGAGEAQLIQMHPGLTKEDVARAWKYVAAHRAEIDSAIRENQEA